VIGGYPDVFADMVTAAKEVGVPFK